MLEKLQEKLSILKGGRDFTNFEELFFGEIIEDEFIIRSDGNLSAGYVLGLPERESQTEIEIQRTQEHLEKCFSQLPIGTVVHFKTVYFYPEKSAIAAAEYNSSGMITRKLSDHLSVRPVLKQQTFLYICFNFNDTKVRTVLSTWLSSIQRVANYFLMKDSLKDLPANKIKASSVLQSLEIQLKSLDKIKLKRLDDEGLIFAKLRYFNLQFGKNPEFLTTQFHNKGNCLVTGTSVIKAETLIKTGSQLFFSNKSKTGVNTYMAWPLGKNIDCQHIVNAAFMISDTEAELKTLDRFNKIRLGMFTDRQKHLSIFNDTNAFTEEVRSQGKQIVQFNHNILTWANSEEEANYNLDLIRASYQVMNGSISVTEPLSAASYFFTFSPGMALEMFKPLKLSLTDALLHVDLSKSAESEQKGIILCNRDHEPVLVDLWSPSLNNKNRIIIGPSGSGKSFTMNTILGQEYEQGVEVIVIDVGGSYRNFFDLKKGKYYEYTLTRPISFNPFLITKTRGGKWNLSSEKITFLLSLIAILWKKPNEGLSKEEESIITDYLTEYYKSLNDTEHLPRLDRFVEFVNSDSHFTEEHSEFFDRKSFTLVLKKFTTGPYASVLNSDTNEDINLHKLVGFDMVGIKKDPILYPIVAMMIINLIIDKMGADLTIRKEIIIDEAWSMLSGNLGKFIEELFRTIRKMGGSVSIITQGIIELESNKYVGEAIKNNAATVILLDHRDVPEQLPRLKSFFGYTDHIIDMVKSLQLYPTHREMFMMRANVPQVFKIDVGPHNMAAFQTNALDKAKMEELTERGHGPEYAVNQFVEDVYKLNQ